MNPHAISGVLDLKTQIQTLSGYRAQSRQSTGGSGAVQVGASDNTVWLLHDIWVYQLFRLTFNTHQDTTWCSSDFPVLAVAHCVVRDWEIYGLNIHQALLWLYAKHTCEVLNPKKKKQLLKDLIPKALGPAKPKQESYVMRMSWFRTAFLWAAQLSVCCCNRNYTLDCLWHFPHVFKSEYAVLIN